MKMKMEPFNRDFITPIEQFLTKFRIPAWVLLGVFLLALPHFGFNTFIMRLFIMIGIFSMLGLGLNILMGYTGLVSLGHAGFFAIGAYTSALLMVHTDLPFLVTLIAAAITSGVVGGILGLPTLRLSGNYLTIVTLGFGEIVRMVIMNWRSVTNGVLGVRSPRPVMFGMEFTFANHGFYYTMLVLLLLTGLTSAAILHSRTGRAFLAIKEDEIAATMMGIRITRYKILAFTISATITGVAGGFYASLMPHIDHDVFTFDVSVLIVSIVIVGGMGTMRGMFLGAIILIAFPEVSRFLMEYRFVVYGLLLILMMRFRPQGILGWKSRLPYNLPKLVQKRVETGVQ
ncbi:MAG: branched-chain amino acid ABC transporter permease [Oscillospiraceae bacterium]|nr:branched-chain amino acid ABC transporter permease [Oscillospiraceae bacterium]